MAVTRAASPPPAVRRHDRAVAEEELFNIDDGGRGGDEDEEDDSGGGDTLMNEFQLTTLTENWGWLFSFQANHHVQHILTYYRSAGAPREEVHSICLHIPPVSSLRRVQPSRRPIANSDAKVTNSFVWFWIK